MLPNKHPPRHRLGNGHRESCVGKLACLKYRTIYVAQMDKKIVAYKILAARPDGVIQEISNLVAQGWQPFGGVSGVDGNLVAQAVVKYADDGWDEFAYFSGKSLADLAIKLTEAMREGWKPFGNITVNPVEENERYIQAFVRNKPTATPQ